MHIIEKIANTFMLAPIENDGWDLALRMMAEQTGSARGQLIAFGNDHAVPFSYVTDVTDEWISDFMSFDGGNPKVNWRVACTRPPFEIAYEKDYRQARAQIRSDIYDDFVHRSDMVNGCQTVLARDDSMFFGLAALRTAADGPTSEDQRALFATMARFALVAVRMQISLAHKGAQLIGEAFHAMDAAIFLFDRRGKVVATSLGADHLLTAGDCPLRLTEGRLTAQQAVADRILQRGLNHALQGPNSQVPRIWLAGEHVLDGHICDIFQLPRHDWSFGHEPRILLVVRQAKRQASSEAGFLKDVLGLTSAEADIARLLAEGTSREDIAQLRGTAQSTVHTQIKSLFRKADVSRETQLASLVTSLLTKP